MPAQALYLKWRPLAFEDVVGQEHVTRTLRNSIKTGRIRHAYLFSGPRGTGKTTSARLLAKAVNCINEDMDIRPCNNCAMCNAVNEGRFLDLIEIDAASHTGVDDVRDLRDRIAFTPNEGQYKVYIIDEVHRFSGNAFDALLKTLEEPPDHALFVLATTEIDKVPATIKSRCLPFEFRRLSLQEVTDRLAFIAEQEGLDIERAALELIAREGTGSVRDSISLLDQIVADPEEKITLELTQRILGTASARAVRDLIDALVKRETGRGIHVINQAIDAGSDPRQFGQQVVEHLRSVMLAQTASADLLQASQDDRELFTEQANQISRSDLLRAVRAFNEAVNTYSGGWQPQLALELALIESLQAPEPVQVVQQTPRRGAAMKSQGANQSEQKKERAADFEAGDPADSGKPPVIAPSLVASKWVDAQTLIFKHSHNAGDLIVNLPNLMEHARVVTVEGNVVVMGVQQKIYLDKLSDDTRVQWVARAIKSVTDSDETLHVRYVLIDDLDNFQYEADDTLTDDPLIQEGLELGGQIRDDSE
ncbi:MAG: DNA polymerase III subunit gamma/tau [Chloroflexota bacterium]